MKKKRISKCILQILVTMVFFVSVLCVGNKIELFAEEKAAYRVESFSDYNKSFSNGTLEEMIKSTLLIDGYHGDIVVKSVSGNDSETWTDVKISTVEWSSTPETGYDPLITKSQSFDWKGKVKSGTKITNSNKEATVSEDMIVTAKIQVNATTVKYGYNSIDKISFNISTSTSANEIKDIKKTLSDNYTKLDINVYNYTGNKRITEIWKKTAPVVWQDAPYSADYSNHKYTWKGTVSKGTYTYDNSKTVTISDDVEVFAEINNSSSSSSSSSSTHYIVTEDDIEIYPYYYKGAIDTSGTDLTIKTDITTGIVKKILKTQVKEGNFMDDIGYAMDSLQYLSLIADVEDIDSSDRDDDAVDAIEKMAKKSKSEAKIPSNRYFDITVCFATYDKDGGTGYTEYSSDEIEDAGSSLTFKYTVPEGTRLSGSSSSSVKRRYRIYTYHEDDEEAANCNDDWKELDSNAFSFSSKKFSTFALSYYDSSSSTSSSSGSSYNSSMRSGSGSGSSPVNDTIDKSGAPKTGDDFDARKWVFILIIGVVVALCSLILYQDTKDWREDKREK